MVQLLESRRNKQLAYYDGTRTARPPKSTEFLYLRIISCRMYRGLVLLLTRRYRIQWKSGILLVKWRESKAELRLNAMYVLLVYVGLLYIVDTETNRMGVVVVPAIDGLRISSREAQVFYVNALLPSSAQRELSACVSVADGRTPQNISGDEGVSFRIVCATHHRTRTSVFNPGMQTEQTFIYGCLEQYGAFGSRRKILPRRSRSF